MHRLIRSSVAVSRVSRVSLLVLLAGSAGCGSNKKPAATGDADGGSAADGGGSTETAGGEKGDGGPEKKDECVGFDVGNLEDMLLKSSCEETAKPDSFTPVDMKGKLEVTVSSSPTRVLAGGKADLLVSFSNKSKEPLILHFKIDPVPRFEVEVWAAPTKKGPSRADMPTGSPPPPPKGATQPPPSEPKAARITIAPNGSARVRIPWEAVKMKWAPEKFRGTPPERGFPRAAAGPLPKGKYTVKVVTPLVGVAEGIEHEVSAPKVEIEIGG